MANLVPEPRADERLQVSADEVMPKPAAIDESYEEASVARERTQLPGAWGEARQTLEKSLDESMHSTAIPAIHAMEPVISVTQSADQETKWQVQLGELKEMGFMNRSLNIEVLERYQGRLLRVVNFCLKWVHLAKALTTVLW
ncbi:hypothetical protein PInf_016793 [Phytophthora infestans]|nr:hypothetical protein PInf_016793 [Phytophthora infestans]